MVCVKFLRGCGMYENYVLAVRRLRGRLTLDEYTFLRPAPCTYHNLYNSCIGPARGTSAGTNHLHILYYQSPKKE